MYDRVHRIAFYERGCCAWHEIVEAAGVPSPPKSVVNRDLTSVRTARGVYLGETPSQVRSAYGDASLHAVAEHRGVVELSYTTLPPYNSPESHTNSSGQILNFVFRNGHLVLVQLEDGC
ncbi:MAG: hypothetical protein ACXWNV_12915 [Vulcanimicrobiaceae bacterium]